MKGQLVCDLEAQTSAGSGKSHEGVRTKFATVDTGLIDTYRRQ